MGNSAASKVTDFGTGRIGEIIRAIEEKHKNKIRNLPEDLLLEELCTSMQISALELDTLITSNSPVFRTVKGHVFETFFDELVERSGHETVIRGGDDEIDRLVNGITLQLKTPTEAGTSGQVVQYKTHKTHGAKSEQESLDYYSKEDHFAEILVGLVSYDPLNLLFLAKDEIPRHPKSPSHLLSPFKVNWVESDALNAFGRIGIETPDLSMFKASGEEELLPKTSAKIGVASSIIIRTILSESNFRIWDMSVRGFIREYVLNRTLQESGIEPIDPMTTGRPRSDKADLVITRPNGSLVYLQMKGVSTNNCRFNRSNPEIATETQLTRGRVNDHPTQSRLYLASDFDYLVLALDPPMVNKCRISAGMESELSWEFFAIPVEELGRHSEMNHRLRSLQKYGYKELQNYKITDWNLFASNC